LALRICRSMSAASPIERIILDDPRIQGFLCLLPDL
jgi:hypothetical protein